MKIAVITGASSGMGREFVLQLSRREQFDEIWVIARRKERLEALKPLVDTPLRVVPLDLSAQPGWDAYAALLAAEQPDVRVLVNASGFGRFGTYAEIPLADSLGMLDLNCKALVAMTELTLPYMREGAKILQLDSLSSFQPVPYINVYGATKAFVLSYSRALNMELKPRGIHCMAMCPGWVKTEFFDHAIKKAAMPSRISTLCSRQRMLSARACATCIAAKRMFPFMISASARRCFLPNFCHTAS